MSQGEPARRRGLKALGAMGMTGMAGAVGSLGAWRGLAGVAGVGTAGVPWLAACSQGNGHLTQALPARVTGGWLGPVMARGHAWRDGQAGAAASGTLSGASSGGVAGTVRRVHTLIVGAGVAGLSAAHHLMQQGIDDIALVDLDDLPGGNAQGHQMGGLGCPIGAHYLPMPGPQATEVQAFLAELGVIRMVHGRWVADERYTCHDPQERLFVPETAPASRPDQAGDRQGQPSPTDALWRHGQWQDGLWPPAPPASRAAWRQLATAIAQARRELGFAMPTHRAPWTPAHTALDGITFTQWLDAQGLHDPGLRWLMDYVCRDDYGASAQRVSAWAGLHYFASRHGLNLPAAWADAGAGAATGAALHDDDPDPVLTWPEGNGWLTQRLAQPLGARWHPGQMAVAVSAGRESVTVDTVAMHPGQPGQAGRPQRWLARHVVLAVPLRLAQRLLDTTLAPLQAVAPLLDTAPWLVSNLLLSEPLSPRPGEALSWDNVSYTPLGIDGMPPSLGYVDARHQSLAQPVGASLLTHYWALGGRNAAEGRQWRQALHDRPWQDWAWAVCRDLMRVHPDLPDKLVRIDLRRHGHAMAIPQPGLRSHPGLAALAQPQGPQGRLHFAHADLSAYSVFEEAFTHGARAAREVRKA